MSSGLDRKLSMRLVGIGPVESGVMHAVAVAFEVVYNSAKSS